MDDTVAVARRAREPQDAPSMFLCPTLTGRPYREGYTARPRLTGPVLPFPPATAQLTWRSGGASPSSPCPGASASASTCSLTTTSTTRTSSRCVTAPTRSVTRRGSPHNVSQNCAFSREPPTDPIFLSSPSVRRTPTCAGGSSSSHGAATAGSSSTGSARRTDRPSGVLSSTLYLRSNFCNTHQSITNN